MSEDRSGPVPPDIPPIEGGHFKDFIKWRRERRARIRRYQLEGEKLPVVHPRAGQDLGAPNSVTWAGHASVIHRLDGHTVLNDPVWSRRLTFIIKRLTPAAPRWEDLPTPELVTVSHNHYDHMDADTLRRVRSTATVCVPQGVARWFERRRFANVHEFDWWETRDIGELKVTFVPAQHFSGRTPFDRNRSLFGGWVVQSRHRTIYHAGDSGYFDGFKEIGERFRGIDVACLPVGAYEPRWFMRPFHVDPEEAGQAFLDVKARTFLPIHWGSFRLTDERMDEPPARVRRFFDTNGLDASRLWIPDLGETKPVDGSTPAHQASDLVP